MFCLDINELDINQDVIAITESHIKENLSCSMNIQFPTSIEHSPIKASSGCAHK